MANPTIATSTTSLATVASGAVTFVTQPSLTLAPGVRVNAKSAATTDWMEGAVTSNVGENLTVSINKSSGTGTHADWNISLALAAPGPTGATGATGAAPPTGPIILITPGPTPAGVDPTSETAMPITRRGVLTVAVVTTKSGPKETAYALTLPKDAQILDLVEVHRAPDSTGPEALVFPNKDEAIGRGDKSTGKNSASVFTGVGDGRAAVFRKVSKSLWLLV